MINKLAKFLLFSTIFILWVDVFISYGYIQSLSYIPSKIFLVISILLSLLVFLTSGTKSNPHRSRIVTIPLIASVIYVLSLTMEGMTTQGYIFSHFHLRPESMLYPVFATLVTALSLTQQVKSSVAIRLVSLLLSISIGYYFLRQFPIITVQASSLISAAVSAPHATYGDKMRSHWGDFYDYMQYLKQNLPQEGTTLGIPPQQNPWLLYGNGMLVQSFIYPSLVTNIDLSQEGVKLPPYMMQLPDWPPNNPSKSNEWGIIKQ